MQEIVTFRIHPEIRRVFLRSSRLYLRLLCWTVASVSVCLRASSPCFSFNLPHLFHPLVLYTDFLLFCLCQRDVHSTYYFALYFVEILLTTFFSIKFQAVILDWNLFIDIAKRSLCLKLFYLDFWIYFINQIWIIWMHFYLLSLI